MIKVKLFKSLKRRKKLKAARKLKTKATKTSQFFENKRKEVKVCFFVCTIDTQFTKYCLIIK